MLLSYSLNSEITLFRTVSVSFDAIGEEPDNRKENDKDGFLFECCFTCPYYDISLERGRKRIWLIILDPRASK